ncbi:MAG: hypothetical protein E7441_02040 [Ruminococcaceae bacterium]|nr:hypothetical protein [Oscillospiraceae bacterium]
MKKLLSIILAAAMLLSLIPSVFAEGAGTVIEQKIEFKDSTSFVMGNQGSSPRYSVSIDDGVLKWSAQCRAMGDNSRNAYFAFVAIPFKATYSGQATVYLRSAEQTTTSADVSVFVVKNTGVAVCGDTCSSKPSISDGKVKGCYFVSDDYSGFYAKNVKGRFDFSKATPNEDAQVYNAENKVELVKDEDYYFILIGDATSIKNQPIGLSTHSNQETYPNERDVYDYYVKNDVSVPSVYKQTFALSGIKLVKTEEKPTESPEYVSAFTPSATVENSTPANADVIPLAYATDGTDIKPTNIKATGDENGTYIVTTDAEVGGYTFRYWARGLESKDRKRIVSFANEFTYTPSNEKNYLIAVYDKAGTTAAATEYYNANGQKLANGDELPYMAGYGQATGWKEPVYGIKEAIYSEPIKYEITIGDAEPVEYAWGTPVECPEPTEPEGQEFWGWKKTVNDVDVGIVSTDPNYTFYAWESCTVTPVYKEAAPVFDGEKRRIILGTFLLGGKTAVMAEFFGFDNVLERGITIDGTDYAMTNKNADQFTIVDDDNKGNISGYAILEGGLKLIYNLPVNNAE